MPKGKSKKSITPSKIALDLEELKCSDSDISIGSIEDPTDPDQQSFLELDEDELEEEIDAELENLRTQEVKEEEEENERPQSDVGPIWGEFSNRQKVFRFIGRTGMQIDLPPNVTPFECFSQFVNDDLLDMIVRETNSFAEQQIRQRSLRNAKKPIKPKSRIQNWVATTKEEIKVFLGLLLWMGLTCNGSIDEYWSQDILFGYKVTRPGITLSRNRFQLLLNCIQFNNNEGADRTNILSKISPLVEKLNANFQRLYVPAEDVVIDETLVPWRGKLRFRQYIPNKAHKYGIKLFKLCATNGYTYNFSIYAGKNDSGLAKIVCENLMMPLLNEGRTLYIDNFYTSYELAASFLKNKTHVVGTLRAGRRQLPKELKTPIKRGEMISYEEENGIVVLKWKDKRDVYILSTKHKPVMVDIPISRRAIPAQEDDVPVAGPSHHQRRIPILARQKPEAILAYNKGKARIDLSDQMASYATTIRKGVKWYRKLAAELLLGLSVVNSRILYMSTTRKKIKIREFRKILAKSLLGFETDTTPPQSSPLTHKLTKRTEPVTNKVLSRYCKPCYKRASETQGRDSARKKNKKTIYYCPGCEGEAQMCYECFTAIHKKT